MDKIVQFPISLFKAGRGRMVVYKMWVGEYFYIGSTINLRDRIRKHCLRFLNGNNYKALMDKFITSDILRFEIIDYAHDNRELRDKERVIIASFLVNDYCLNKSDHTKVAVGYSSSKKLVKRYNEDGSFIIFPSITKAADSIGSERNNLSRDVKLGYKIKGFVFRFIDINGNDIIPPSRRHRKGNWKKKEPTH